MRDLAWWTDDREPACVLGWLDIGLGLTWDSSSNRDYIQIRSPVYIPHSAGRFAAKRFRKANCPIIERLTNSLMMHGRNNGKKLKAVRIVAHAFEIVSLERNCDAATDVPG